MLVVVVLAVVPSDTLLSHQTDLPDGPVDIWTEGEKDVLHSSKNAGDEGDAVGAEEIRVFERIVIGVLKEEVRPRYQDGAHQRESHC